MTRFILIFFWNFEYFNDFNINFIVTTFRFDFMVIGYIALPAMILLVFKDNLLRRSIDLIFLVYFYLIIFSFVVVSISEFIFIKVFSNRWNSSDLNPILESYPDFIHEYLEPLRQLNTLPILLFSLVVLVFGIFTSYFIKKSVQKPAIEKLSAKKIFISVIFYVLCIRSSLGSYHLDLRHSEVSTDKTINSLTVNSLYLLDQTLRQRR